MSKRKRRVKAGRGDSEAADSLGVSKVLGTPLVGRIDECLIAVRSAVTAMGACADKLAEDIMKAALPSPTTASVDSGDGSNIGRAPTTLQYVTTLRAQVDEITRRAVAIRFAVSDTCLGALALSDSERKGCSGLSDAADDWYGTVVSGALLTLESHCVRREEFFRALQSRLEVLHDALSAVHGTLIPLPAYGTGNYHPGERETYHAERLLLRETSASLKASAAFGKLRGEIRDLMVKFAVPGPMPKGLALGYPVGIANRLDSEDIRFGIAVAV